MTLHVDGTLPCGSLVSWDGEAPFRVFDDERQDWIGPAFAHADRAKRYCLLLMALRMVEKDPDLPLGVVR